MAKLSIEERMDAYEKELKRLQRAQDYCDIQNVFALHEYYHHLPSVEVEMIFAKKQKDVSFGQNWGVWVGLDHVKAYYKSSSKEELQKRLDTIRKYNPDIPNDIKYANAGSGMFHMLTTPIIEVAEDGQTAKGMWYTPAASNSFNEREKKWQAGWMYEKYAVDFIKEDGKWKIWHFNVFCDFGCTFEKSWVDAAEEERLNPRPPMEMPINVPPDLPGPGFKEYSTRRVWQLPKPPEPYRTFSETFSYGPGKMPVISGSLD